MRLPVARRVTLAVLLGLGVHVARAHAQVTVGGVGYVQYGYALQPDSSLVTKDASGNVTRGALHNNNFDVTRAYINVTAKFSDGVAARITPDIDGRGLSFGGTSEAQLTFRLKYAFVSWQPHAQGPLTYKLGLVQTPWIDWEEALWDYRMQGPVAVDRNGVLKSSDFGAAVDGMWHYDQFAVQLGVYNGEGYNGTPGDPGKDFEARASLRLMKSNLPGRTGGLRLNGYVQYGKANGGGTRQRFIGNLSYKSKSVTFGAEYAVGQDSTNAAHPEQKSSVISAFGVVNVPNSKVAVIGRVDIYDPNTDSTSTAKSATGSNKQTRIIGGLSYTISPNLRVLADVDLNSLENGSTNSFDKTRQMLFFHTQFTF